jgi:hypothetical protein
VADAPVSKSGIFIASAWLEPGNQRAVRARIRYTPDLEDQPPTVVVVASFDDACERLSAWWVALQEP